MAFAPNDAILFLGPNLIPQLGGVMPLVLY